MLRHLFATSDNQSHKATLALKYILSTEHELGKIISFPKLIIFPISATFTVELMGITKRKIMNLIGRSKKGMPSYCALS